MDDPIAPDNKDWTWVLSRPCPECGYDARAIARTDLAQAFRAEAASWPAVLARPDVARRPRPGVWSALEYGCHVRDVLRISVERLARLLSEHDPLFANWDQDQTAIAERYAEQDPAVVTVDLLEAGAQLADGYGAVTAWDRPGRRSDGAVFTVETLGRYQLHDPVHHRWDVRS